MARLKGPARREQLLAVATQLFSERGYDATTTAAIAEAAGITEPVLYRHFENKKDLFIAVLRQCTALLISRWHQAIEGNGSATEQVRRMAAIVASVLPELQHAQRVVYGAMSNSTDPEVRAVLDEHGHAFGDLALQIVEHGQQTGEFRSDLGLRPMAWSLVNMYTGFSFTRLNYNSEEVDIRVGVELVVTGLCKPTGASR